MASPLAPVGARASTRPQDLGPHDQRPRGVFLGATLALALGAAACGGGDGGGSDGGTTGGGGCTPSGATVLADYASFDESPAYSMHLFGDKLFVQYISQVVELPVAGGAPVQRYKTPNEFSTGIGTYPRNGSELVLVPSGNVPITVLPVAGGAGTQPTLDRTDQLIVGYDAGTDALVAQVTNTADTHDLALVPMDGSPRRVVLAAQPGASFFVNWDIMGGAAIRRFEGNSSAIQAVTLADGSVRTIAVSPSAFRIHHLTATHLFFVHGETLGQAGIWRQPLAGGAAERVVDAFIAGGTFAAGAGRYAFHAADRLFTFTDAAPGVAATQTDLPVAGTGCTSHSVAVSADNVFSTMYRSLAETSMVFRVGR